MKLERYLDQLRKWPKDGRHILAGFDEENIVVYQAYRPAIGLYAASNQKFGGEFSFSRMSWIKTNFLWMMYRSGWGTKEGQEIILAVTIPRTLFDEILSVAVPSSYDSSRYPVHDEWRQALEHSEVRLQWDPDHDPTGAPTKRRAVQLGLRGDILRRYAVDEVVRVENISELVARERLHAKAGFEELLMPEEDVYLPALDAAVDGVGLHIPRQQPR